MSLHYFLWTKFWLITLSFIFSEVVEGHISLSKPVFDFKGRYSQKLVLPTVHQGQPGHAKLKAELIKRIRLRIYSVQ